MQDKLDKMNDKVTNVLNSKEEIAKERKQREELALMQREFDRSKKNGQQDMEKQRLVDKLREKDERYKKLKMDKEEYNKFYHNLKKDLTIKKQELQDEVYQKTKIS